jgi:hypothetical protein
MVNVLLLKAVDRGYIGGVMVNVLVSKVVDRGLIGGVLFSILVSKAVDRGFIGGGLRSLSRKRYIVGSLVEKNVNHYATNGTHNLPFQRQVR